MNRTRKEIELKIESLKRELEPFGATLMLDPKRILESRQHCFWYGGEIGRIRHRGVDYVMEARGCMEGELICQNTGSLVASYRDLNNMGEFLSIMSPYLENDTALENAILADCLKGDDFTVFGPYRLTAMYGNWLECTPMDAATGEWIATSTMIDDDDDVLTAFTDFQYYLDTFQDDVEDYKKRQTA